jgi:hypothetical protein
MQPVYNQNNKHIYIFRGEERKEKGLTQRRQPERGVLWCGNPGEKVVQVTYSLA